MALDLLLLLLFLCLHLSVISNCGTTRGDFAASKPGPLFFIARPIFGVLFQGAFTVTSDLEIHM